MESNKVYPGKLYAYRLVRNYISAQKALVVTTASDLKEDDAREAWYAFDEMLRILTKSKDKIMKGD